MSMIISNGTKQVLAANVTNASIKASINTFGANLAAQWDTLTELAAAVLIHYATQDEVIKGHKGDITLIEALGHTLFLNNRTMYMAFNKAVGKIAALSSKVEDLPEDAGVKIIVGVTGKSRADMLSGFDAAITELVNKGIKLTYGPAVKAPSKGKGKGSKAADGNAPSESVSVSPGQHIAEETGIMAVLTGAEGEQDQARLKEIGPLLAELMQLAMECQNIGLVKDQLTSATGKIRKGMISFAQPMSKAS